MSKRENPDSGIAETVRSRWRLSPTDIVTVKFYPIVRGHQDPRGPRKPELNHQEPSRQRPFSAAPSLCPGAFVVRSYLGSWAAVGRELPVSRLQSTVPGSEGFTSDELRVAGPRTEIELTLARPRRPQPNRICNRRCRRRRRVAERSGVEGSLRTSTDYADYADCPERARNSERKTADYADESRIEDCQSSGRTEPDSCDNPDGIRRRVPKTWRPQDRGDGEKQRRENDDPARL